MTYPIALVKGTDVKLAHSPSREVELRYQGYTDQTVENLEDLSYPELQALAKAAGIKSSQSKADLVAALGVPAEDDGTAYVEDTGEVDTAEPVAADADDSTDTGNESPEHSLLDGPAAGETADFA